MFRNLIPSRRHRRKLRSKLGRAETPDRTATIMTAYGTRDFARGRSVGTHVGLSTGTTAVFRPPGGEYSGLADGRSLAGGAYLVGVRSDGARRSCDSAGSGGLAEAALTAGTGRHSTEAAFCSSCLRAAGLRNADAAALTTRKRQHRTLRPPQYSLFCDVAKVTKTSVALIGSFATT